MEHFIETIDDWNLRIEAHQRAHSVAAESLDRRHYLIGLPATILTAIAGGTLLSDTTIVAVRIAAGIVGLLSAVLTAVQTFYSFAKRAETHRTTSAQLGEVRRALEILKQFPPAKPELQKKAIQEISARLAKIDSTAPVLYRKSFEIAQVHPVDLCAD